MPHFSDGPNKCHTCLPKQNLSDTVFEHTFESKHHSDHSGQIHGYLDCNWMLKSYCVVSSYSPRYFKSCIISLQGLSGATLPRSVPISPLNVGSPCTSNFGNWSQANASLVIGLAQSLPAGFICAFSFVVTNPASGQVIVFTSVATFVDGWKYLAVKVFTKCFSTGSALCQPGGRVC